MAFMAMKALHGEFLGDMESIGAYANLADAQRHITEDMWSTARSEGADEDEIHN